LKHFGLIVASFLILVSLILMGLIYFDWVSTGFMVGSYRFHHWNVLIGTFYLAVVTPVFALLKRSKPESLRNLFRVHVFGNLLAILLISIHFASQLSRPLQFYPDLGSGIGLFSAMGLLAFTGFFLRFRLTVGRGRRIFRWVHVLAVVSFYLVIVVHALHGFGFI
jgi:hypothetical protein